MSKKNNYKVYLHTNLINGKKYVGQTVCTLNARWANGHGYKPKKNNNSHFYNAIQKYGWSNFKHEVLKSNLTLPEADFWERHYIAQFDSTNPLKGYNKTHGGHNAMPTEEAKTKMRKKRPSISGKNHYCARAVMCIDTQEKFDTIKDACNKYNISSNHIGSVCKKKRSTVGGLRFCYLEDFKESMVNEKISLENKKNIQLCKRSRR